MGKSGRTCTICTHERRAAIDIAITHKVSARIIAIRFGVSKDAVQRHGKSHLSPIMRAALLTARKPSVIDLDALRASESEGLLAQLVAQRARLQSHVEIAADLGDVRTAVSAEGAITANLTLVGKLLGQLAVHHNVTHTSILISADYLRLRATLLAALRPYPDAARSVGAALHAMESEAATDITARAGQVPALIEHDATPPAAVTVTPPPC